MSPEVPPQPPLDAQAFVRDLLLRASRAGASDVYWIPSADGMDVRLRCDGVQRVEARLSADDGATCVTCIKVLARLLTYRTRIAQDGVIAADGAEQPEMRVSVMPTLHGERVAVRLLHAGARPRRIEDLGFPAPAATALKRMLEPASGLIVLTGPTGSGKTTTIYAMIRELLARDMDPASIVTIEDPVECEIPGVSQTAVQPESGWDYAAAFRSALRQDVKTIVVGEMRDREVVQVTLDAALTGHRVITTFHAGDIAAIYARILHQGFEPFLVAAAVTGTVTQRLAPAAQGGRMPVAATLIPDDDWREFVAANPGLGELRKRLRERPASDLAAVGADLVASGAIRHFFA